MSYYKETRRLLELNQTGEKEFDYKNYKFGDHLVYREELIELIENLGGQLFFFMDISRWDLNIEQRWYRYFKDTFIPDKKFYIVFEEEEFSTHTILDLDTVVDFFKERGVDKDKLIWISASHNLNDVLKRLNNYLDEKDITIKYGDSRFTGDERIKGYLTSESKIKNYDIKSFGFSSLFFGMLHLDNKEFLDSIKTTETPNKLFVCPIGVKKNSRVNLMNKFYERNFINSIEKILPEDRAWVSLNWDKRLFEGDVFLYGKESVPIPKIFKQDDYYVHGNSKETIITFYHMRKVIQDSWLYFVIESEVGDYRIWEDNGVEGNLFHWTEKNIQRLCEKFIVPILFKKPFLNFGPIGGLDILKDYGFKTFDCIFDERYDTELDVDKRIYMMLDEIERLEKLGLDKVTKEVEPILEHNYNLLLDMNCNRKYHLKRYIERNLKL